MSSNNLLVLRVLCLFLAINLTQNLHGQTVADNWYFGNNAGITFIQNTPVALTNSAMVAGEGCTSWSDNAGNLMFYSDGDTIWNRNHEVMLNGTGLLGSTSSTQSAITCPFPDNPDKFFLFTVAALGNVDGLRYSIIDMTLDAGLGGVEAANKNILLHTPACEKVTAIENCDKSGYWVVAHDFGSNEIYSYEISSTGINTNEVISYGQIVTDSNDIGHATGYMKASPKGRYIGMCHESLHLFEIFEFDKSSGQLTNPIVIPTPNLIHNTLSRPYGLEFSPDGNRLYVSPRASFNGYLCQYTLSNYDSTSIKSSEFMLYDSISSGALQLGPNGRIYGSNFYHLREVLNPNVQGTMVNLIDSSISLHGNFVQVGLPNFIQSFFKNPIETQSICLGDSIAFEFIDSCLNSVVWNFDDPQSGSANSSTSSNPTHVFSDTGVYNVRLIATYPGATDTFSNAITVYSTPPTDFLEDTTQVCTNDSVVLNAYHFQSQYLWSTGDTVPGITVSQEGDYTCTITNPCGQSIDSTSVIQVDSIVSPLTQDRVICDGDTVYLGSEIAVPAQYLWSTGDTTSSLLVSNALTENYEPITLWLEASNACNTVSDTATISFLPQPDIGWFSDSVLCDQNAAVVPLPTQQGVDHFMTYTTDDVLNDTLPKPWRIDTHGLYYLHAFNVCDTLMKRAFLSPQQVIALSLGEDIVLCPGDSVVLDAAWPGSTYQWNDAVPSGQQTDSSIVAYADDIEGEVIYIVTITLPPCQRIASKTISVLPAGCDTSACKFSVPNVFSPNADGINDVLAIENSCDDLRYSISIYNRWGQLVFAEQQRSATSISWDGSINGEAATEGTYYLIIEHGEEKAQRAVVTLVK